MRGGVHPGIEGALAAREQIGGGRCHEEAGGTRVEEAGGTRVDEAGSTCREEASGTRVEEAGSTCRDKAGRTCGEATGDACREGGGRQNLSCFGVKKTWCETCVCEVALNASPMQPCAHNLF